MVSPQVAQVAPGAAGWRLPQSASEPTGDADRTTCPRCGTSNSHQMRFCVGCGQRLVSDDGPPQIAGVSAVVGQPSQPVAVVGGLPPGVTVCWRCHGAGDPGAAFCKFCGARYEDASRAAAGPAPAVKVQQPVAAPVAAPMVAPMAAPVLPTAPGGAPIPYTAPTVGEPIAALVAILKDGSDGRTFPIYAEQADIGRTEGDVILPDDPYLSPRHARLHRRGDGWLLRDLDSANGIYARIREPVDLVDGDMILLGQQVLRFEFLDDGELPLGPATQHGVLMFGTPEVPRMARLTQYTTEGVGRDVHYVYRDETVLGRENGDIVFTDDPFLSRRHAAITADRMSRRFVLRDLGSSNGTAVRFHGERALGAGDQFRVGRHLFRFELVAGPGGRAGR